MVIKLNFYSICVIVETSLNFLSNLFQIFSLSIKFKLFPQIPQRLISRGLMLTNKDVHDRSGGFARRIPFMT